MLKALAFSCWLRASRSASVVKPSFGNRVLSDTSQTPCYTEKRKVDPPSQHSPRVLLCGSLFPALAGGVPQDRNARSHPHPSRFTREGPGTNSWPARSSCRLHTSQLRLGRCLTRRGYKTRCGISCLGRRARGGGSQRRRQRGFSLCDGCWSESVHGKNLTTARPLSPSSPWVSDSPLLLSHPFSAPVRFCL